MSKQTVLTAFTLDPEETKYPEQAYSFTKSTPTSYKICISVINSTKETTNLEEYFNTENDQYLNLFPGVLAPTITFSFYINLG